MKLPFLSEMIAETYVQSHGTDLRLTPNAVLTTRRRMCMEEHDLVANHKSKEHVVWPQGVDKEGSRACAVTGWRPEARGSGVQGFR